jgi:hypothetical protein
MTDSERAMWKSMEQNPLKTHLQIIASGGKKALFDFVKCIAISHNICMEVKPRSTEMVRRWVDMARGMMQEILPHNPSAAPVAPSSEPYISQGIYNAHLRQAYWREVNGWKVAVKATIVNPSKMEKAFLKAMSKIVDSYNEHVVEVARESGSRATTFPDIMKWKIK